MSEIPATCDVVIIGGGPAGSTAASRLALLGYDVVLVDKARFPRLVVGESLIPYFWKYADAIGLSTKVDAARFIRKGGATFYWKDRFRQMKFSDFGFERPALHVDRDLFDEVLLRHAQSCGAAVFEGITITDVIMNDDRACGIRFSQRDINKTDEGELRARYVVDCSGQAAVLARKLKLREFDPDLRFTCWWGYFGNADYVSLGGGVHSFSERYDVFPTTFVVGKDDWSWCWHIALKESTSIGVVFPTEELASFKKLGSGLAERFERAVRAWPATSVLLRDAKLIEGSVRAMRDFAYLPRSLSGPGWFLAGDAAAFVDPINSLGIILATYAGWLVGWSIDGSFRDREQEPYFTRIYDTILAQRMGLYRISSLPEGRNSRHDLDGLALDGAKFASKQDQDLIYSHLMLCGRPKNLTSLYSTDPQWSFSTVDRTTEVNALMRLL